MANKAKGSKKKRTTTPKKRSKRTIALRVISEPEANTRAVIHHVGPGTVVMRGAGQSTLVMECGNCGVPIIEGVHMNQVRGIVFRCKNCGEYNETLA
jgi:hypothetical protein